MDKEKDKILMKNNMFVTARYNLGLIENRIFIIILYKLQKSNGGMSCTISHDEFKAIIGNKNQHSLLAIQNILQEMLSSRVYFVQKKYNKKGNLWGEYALINGYEYDDELNSFKIECSQRVYDLLMTYMNTGGYTPINLKVYVSLNNPNSQRLYDLLRLWSNTKNLISYDVEEMKELLMLENKYNKYSDFKKRVITPAVKELNNTNMFDISFIENKKGRKVDSITFDVKDLDKRIYFKDDQGQFDICNSVQEKKSTPKTNNMYVPDKSVFTVGTLRAFKTDFAEYDFNNRYLEMAFNDAVNITLERDDTEKIYMNYSYKFFRGTLRNKIDYYLDQEAQDEEHKIKLEQFWDKA